MNIAELNTLEDLADFIEQLPDNDDTDAQHGFDMSTPVLGCSTRHPCGSAACIEGWKNAAIGVGGLADIEDPEIMRVSGWHDLCFAIPSGAWEATPQQGAAALREWLVNGNDGTAAWMKALADA